MADNGESSYRRFLEGDDDAFCEIIRDYKDGLILYLNSFTGDYHTSEELMSDTFFKLLVKKPRFKGKSSFKTWLYAIARNEAFGYFRKGKRFTDTGGDTESYISDGESLEQSYIREEQKIRLHHTMNKLKPEYRQVLYLTFFEGFDNSAAAVIMRKSRHGIETLVWRAKKALKAELLKEDYCYEEL